MRQSFSVWASVAALAVGACGGGETSSSNGAGQAAAATPAAAAQPAAGDQGPAQGQAVYQRVCATCHQRNGNGLPGSFPPLAGSDFASGDPARLIKIVLHGLQGPLEVRGQRYNNIMPPWRSLSDREIAAALTYVRSSFGNSASAVTADQVAEVRAATAGRTAMWTVRELE
jgi:mono/diheme cytochrome c family protein